MNLALFDQRPVIVAIAGPNGAGKTTFFHAHLREAGLRFVNADDLARELSLDPYPAAELAGAIRNGLVRQRESFIFETVFSDPVGMKLKFLKDAASAGYVVGLCYIGLTNADLANERVAMRLSQGGHDVPLPKIRKRYRRSLHNLKSALRELPHVMVFDNSNFHRPFRRVAVFENGTPVFQSKNIPSWLELLL